MKADYLILTDGRKVRIEWNWNAVKSWTRFTGKELAELANKNAGPDEMLAIAYCAAIEGEDADGRELGLTEKEFGRLINMQGIIEFSKILTQQTATEEQKKRSPEEITEDLLQEQGIDLADLSKFTYAAMYRRALGAMNYTPERFGEMRVGDFFDALAGHDEAELERFKCSAELIRTSTTILRNAHIINESDLKTAEQLWHFPWDKNEDEQEESELLTEKREETETDLLKILKRQTENGHSNKPTEGEVRS